MRSAMKKMWCSARLQDAYDGRWVERPSAVQVASSYSAFVLADTPKLFWKCQEASGALQDASGNSLPSTTTGGTPSYQVTGPFGTDYGIQLNLAGFKRATVTTVTNNFTYELWLKVTTIGDFDLSYFQSGARDLGSNSSTRGHGVYSSGPTNVKIHMGYDNVADLADTAALGTGTWKHIAFVRDAGTAKYYINGAVDNSNAGTSTPAAPQAGDFTRIGSTFSSTNNYTIIVAYAAFYESALSASRIAIHAGALLP